MIAAYAAVRANAVNNRPDRNQVLQISTENAISDDQLRFSSDPKIGPMADGWAHYSAIGVIEFSLSLSALDLSQTL